MTKSRFVIEHPDTLRVAPFDVEALQEALFWFKLGYTVTEFVKTGDGYAILNTYSPR